MRNAKKFKGILRYKNKILLLKKDQDFTRILVSLIRNLEDHYPAANGLIVDSRNRVIYRCRKTTCYD